eukprot:6176306-Pleurochrysis_carterae.AAC.5
MNGGDVCTICARLLFQRKRFHPVTLFTCMPDIITQTLARACACSCSRARLWEHNACAKLCLSTGYRRPESDSAGVGEPATGQVQMLSRKCRPKLSDAPKVRSGQAANK